jgi:D-inositol-3-phosphate glycosyltransferase
LTSQITFLGSKPQEVLSDYYSAADVLVVPSHYESFGMVALEAMACGTPVIASKVGGLSMAVQDGITGYLVPNGDPEQLAQKIRLILSQPQLAQEISHQAVAWAQRFRWPLIAQRILEVYDEATCKAIDVAPEKRACHCKSQ